MRSTVLRGHARWVADSCTPAVLHQCRRLSMAVNSFDVADRLPPLPRGTYEMSCGEVSAEHWDQEWSEADIQTASQENGMFTWGASDPSRAGAPLIKRGEGVYLYGQDGKQYLDWTSQAVCTNLGYTVPAQVQQAVTKQLADGSEGSRFQLL